MKALSAMAASLALVCDGASLVAEARASTDGPSGPTGAQGSQVEEQLTFAASKWLNHQKAAVTINIDGAPSLEGATGEVLKRGLRSSYEISTWGRTDLSEYASLLLHSPEPLISFFGHGDAHANHDAMPPMVAEASFRTCRELMGHAGLDTTAYAYPYGRGYRPETQAAVARAGYLMARGIHFRPEGEQSALICPEGEQQPQNWYLLPGILVAERDEKDAPMFNHDATGKLMRSSLKHEAWIILLYHAIDDPRGWGFYPMQYFRKDLDFIASSPFWVDHMQNIGCYVLERQRVKADSRRLAHTGATSVFEFTIDDSIPETTCAQPLTMEISIASPADYSFCVVNGPGHAPRAYSVNKNTFSMNVVPDGAAYTLSCSRLRPGTDRREGVARDETSRGR
jgi:hypothetical protein